MFILESVLMSIFLFIFLFIFISRTKIGGVRKDLSGQKLGVLGQIRIIFAEIENF